MIQNYDFEIAIANVPRAVSIQGNYLEVVEALGTLTIVFSPGYTTTVKKGDVLRSDQFPVEFDGFQLSSDTVNDVIRLKAGRGFSLSLSWLREQMAALIAAVIAIPATVTNAMMQWPEAGIDVPLKSTPDGQNLATGGRLNLLGVLGITSTINTKGYSFLRIVTQAAGNLGDVLQIVDNTDVTAPPINIYDEQGNMFSKNGQIGFSTKYPAGTVYYADVRGVGEIIMNAITGAPAFAFYGSPLEKLPTPKYARQLVLDETDLNVTLGAFASGAGIIFTTAGISAILANKNITPKRISMYISLTPNGADSFALASRSFAGGIAGPPVQVIPATAATAALTRVQFSVNDTATAIYKVAADAAAATGATSFLSVILPADDFIFVFSKTTATADGILSSVKLIVEE